mmetsp:Transcript_45134/g.98128  ORF Transcript_45134/g.98128 Transcript_45134/m.98128 type:complete len:245 (-) Transcript_45134:845-1579(-)
MVRGTLEGLFAARNLSLARLGLRRAPQASRRPVRARMHLEAQLDQLQTRQAWPAYARWADSLLLHLHWSALLGPHPRLQRHPGQARPALLLLCQHAAAGRVAGRPHVPDRAKDLRARVLVWLLPSLLLLSRQDHLGVALQHHPSDRLRAHSVQHGRAPELSRQDVHLRRSDHAPAAVRRQPRLLHRLRRADAGDGRRPRPRLPRALPPHWRPPHQQGPSRPVLYLAREDLVHLVRVRGAHHQRV